MRKLTLFIFSLLMTIGAVAQVNITNTSSYTVKSVNRGFLYYDSANGDYVTSSSHTDLTDATPTGLLEEQFAFLHEDNTAEGQYYMYSVAAQKFVSYTNKNGGALTLTDDPSVTWTLAKNSNYYVITVPGTANTCINITNWQATHGCKVIGTGADDGNKMTLVAVDNVELGAALVKINKFEGNYFATPEAGKYYKIKGDSKERPWLTANATSDGNVVVSANEEDAAVFLKTENGLQAVATGKYLGYAGGKYTYSNNELTIGLRNDGNLANYSNKFAIVSGSNYMYNNSTDGIVHESSSLLDLPRLWAFTEVEAPAPTFEGEGTATSPYLIDSADKLATLSDEVNAGEAYEGVYFKLTSDIALSGEWTAIGNGSRNGTGYTGNAFKGVFDGGNNTISGLTITSTTGAKAAIGLFGVVDGGTVKNLNLTDVNINVASSDLAGAAIGMMLNGAIADAITVSGAVVGHDGVGGIVGRLIIDGTIANCTNNASVTSNYGGIGGIVGKAYYEDGANTATFASITNCTNKGIIKAPKYVGGIAGLARANVSGCVNEGAIVGGTQTGGIVGQLMAAGTVSGNENKAKVTGTSHVGGIIGDYTQSDPYTYNNVSIANNTNRGEISATGDCAAILGCNNIDGFTAMTATGNESHYFVEGLELFGNPEDMVIDATNKFVVPVAQVGTETYYTLADAIAAAQTGDEIVIIANVELTETTEFPAGKTITLNLNNKKVSAADKNVVKNSGAALTIKNGTIERTGTVAGYAVNVVSGTLEVEDVTIVGGLYTSGTSLVATNTNISQASASRHAIYAYNCAVTINSGTYHNDNAGNAAVFAYGSSVVTINNGTFSIDNGKQTFGWTSCLLDANAGGKYVINGGEFKGHFRVQANSAMEINGGTFENTHGEAYAIYGSVAVKGGTFTDAAAQTFAKNNIADDYKLGEDGKVVYAPAVAKIGETKYETLDAAVAAAQEGDKITLLNDAELAFASNPMYNNVYASEIDLNGKTMTIKKGDVRFSNTTIKNGNIVVAPGTYNGTAIFLMYSKNLTFDGVKVTATGVASTYLIGLEGTSNLNLLNGSEIAINNESLVNIGSIIADNGKGNTVIIKDSKIEITNSNARLYLGGTNGNITVENSDIDLNGVKDGFYLRAGQTLAITGTSTVDITLITNEGRYGINLTDLTATYTKAETATVNATLKEVTPAAVIGTQKFATLAAAIAAATDGQTITLVSNVTEDLTTTKKITIDGAGKTYTGAMTLKADATISNLNFDGKGYNGYAITTRGAHYVTIDGGSAKNYGYGFVQLASATVLTTVKNVTVSDMNYGVKVDYSSAVVLENVDITAGVAAVLNSNYGEKTITIKDSKLNILGTWTRNNTVETTYVFEGANTVGKFITDDAIDNFKLAEASTLTAPEGKTVTTDVKYNRVVYADGKYALELCPAKIGEQGYATLQEAINAVQNGQEVVLLKDCAENVTLTEKVGLYYTINGDGKTLNGKITITPLSDERDNRRITIKNIKFVNTADAARDFISCAVTNHYPRLTVEGCTFTGNGKDTDVALRLKTAYGAVIKDCTGTGLHSFIQNTAGKNLTIENVTVTDSKSAFALGTVQGVTVKGCEADVEGYGIRLDANTYNNNAVIESNKIEAFIPVVVRKANTESNITVKGTNEMTATNTDGIWFAAGTSEYETNGTMPDAATGKVKVTLEDKTLDPKGVYGNFGVASIGKVNYNTLAEALTAAKDGEAVNLLWAEGDAPIAMNGAVFGKNVTITGTATVDWSKGFLFVGRGGEGNATVTFDGANLTSASNNASTGIHVSGREKNTNNKYDGTLVIKNSSIELDYLINKGAMTLDKAALTVKNGFATGGRPANETENGQDATATISLTNESKLVVNNHNGMGLGYEAIGVMNIDATSTFETTQSFLVTAKGTMNIAGQAVVAGTLTNQGVINLTSENATLKAQAGLTVNSTVEGRDVIYADGIYTTKLGLKGKGTEAEPYLISNVDELVAFRNSVNEGETKYNAPGVWVVLAADIDLDGTTWTVGIGDGHNWSFDGNFDGKNFAIKNLTVNPYADESGYICGGLFGYIYGAATIQNLVIENATITTDGAGHNVGVLVGFANNKGGKANISNITVKGDVKVDAPNANGVGAIVGYSYRDMGNITNCTVETNEGSYIKGASFVGGITGYSYSGATIANCSVKNIDIIGTSKSVGGVAGIVLGGNTVTGCTVENVSVEGQANVGNVVGAIASNGIVVENCTAVEPIVGGNYADDKAVAARIGNKYYATLDAALAAEGNEVELLATYEVAAGETKTLDLNGKTVTMVYTAKATKNHTMISNSGNLTIQSSVEGGKLSYTYAGENLGTTYSANTVTSNPGSVLTVKSGTIENLTFDSGIIAYAIDGLTNGGAGDVTVNIEGGVITSKRQAVRIFANSTTNTGALNISGGEFTGRVIVQNASAKANKAALNITGGTFNANEYKSDVLYVGGSSSATIDINATVSGGTFNGEITETHVTGFISGGKFANPVAAQFCAEGFMPNKNTDGTYGVVEASGMVATTNGFGYATLAEAIKACVAGDNTIELLADYAEKVTITQVNGTNITINGNGKTYTGTITVKGDKVANNLYNTETLTFKNINFAPAYSTYAITAEKNTYVRNITVDGCTFKGNNDVYGIRVRNGYNYTVKNTTVEGVYTFFNASEALNGLTVENVTVKCASVAFSGAYGYGNASFKNVTVESGNNGIKVNNPNSSALTFENCSITAKAPVTFYENAGVTSALTAEFNGTNTMVVNNGGTYWFNIVEANATDATFKAIVNDANLDMSNTAFAASVGNVYYSNLTTAINEAADGATVVIARDIELDAASCVTNSDGYSVFVNVAGKALTIDLNGKAVTANLSADQFASAKSSLLMAVFSVDTDGNLTLNDSKGTGKVAVTANDASVYSLISNYDKTAKLTINGGSYELDKARAKSSLIHSDPSEAVVVNGGNFYLGNVNTGANGSPWIFNVNGNNTGHVIVNGGTFNYDVNHQYWAFEVHVDKASALKNNGDGTWTVVPAVAYVAEENNGYTRETGYATLEEAVASKYGNVVTMLVDVELSETVTVPAGKEVVLDLNGKTISANIAEQLTKSFAAIQNRGTLTVKDASADADGKISVSYAGNSFGYGVGLYTISNEGGVLNIAGGTIENTTTVSGSMYDAIDNNSTLGETVLNISGGEVVCGQYIGVRQFANNTTYDNIVNVTGGKVVGGNTSIWMQNPNSNANKATVSISGADYENGNCPVIKGRLLAGESTGFNFEVTGGLFDTDVNAFCATDYASYNFGDGTWGVEYLYIDNLTIVDGAYDEFENQNAKTVGTLTYERDMTNYIGKWQPLYVPFEIPVSKLTELGYQVAIFYDVHFELTNEGVINPASAPDLHLLKITSGTLKANYPYVIKPSSDNPQLSIELINATLYSTAKNEMNSVESGSTITRFIFAGTYTKATPAALTGDANIHCYGINKKGNFQKMGSDATLPAFRVYMSIVAKDGSHVILNDAVAESIQMRVIGEENEDGTTFIYDVENDVQTIDYIYDLQGRRVLEPQKGGLYIINGKKVIF